MASQWNFQREKVGELNCASILPPESVIPERLCVLCHGFGASGDDLVSLAEPMIQHLPQGAKVPVFVFPEGPIDLASQGMPGGRAWWPLNMARLMQLAATNDFGAMRNEVPPGIDNARNQLVATIELLMARYAIRYDHLVLGGFSQGAMLATDTTLRGTQQPPGKLLAMSGALIGESSWREHIDRLDNLKIIQSHGRQDSILPIQTGRWLHEFFKSSSAKVDYTEFDGDHTIPYEIIPKLLAE
jgi:phospholipase/carboxylesterase